MIVGWYSVFIANLVCLAGTLLTATKRERPSAMSAEVCYRKEVETVMPANEDAAGSGSLYCFVTETSKKVTL